MRFIVPLLGLAAMASPALAERLTIEPCSATAPCYTKYSASIDNPRRAQDKARDQFRNPIDTLEFMKVEPGMTVVDFMPSGGWYTRILVPYLGTEGRYIGLNPDPAHASNEGMRKYVTAMTPKFKEASPAWNLSGAPVEILNTNDLTDEMIGIADRVLIFREMHNLHRNGMLHEELTAMRALLKDDGLLGIVQHRARPDAPAAYTDGMKGYMRQKDVIGLVEAHGFELVSTSEVNANPKDTADHPLGVWELPPSLRTKRDELKLIGESDRMTLLFRKRP